MLGEDGGEAFEFGFVEAEFVVEEVDLVFEFGGLEEESVVLGFEGGELVERVLEERG